MGFAIHLFGFDRDDVLNRVPWHFIEHCRLLELMLVVWECDFELVDGNGLAQISMDTSD